MHPARAAIADGEGNFTVGEIAVASPQPGEVLVEMRAAGICHTDHASLRWARPLIMGHEGAGIVREIGPGVTHVRERSAGHAHPEGTTRAGIPVDRSFNIGTLSTLTLVKAPAVTLLPDEV